MFIILDREITQGADYTREIDSLPDLTFTWFSKTINQDVVLVSALPLSLNLLFLYK